MEISFYIPLPPIEFYTWLAIYFQFGLMAAIVLINTPCPARFNNARKLAALLFFASLVVIPVSIYLYITDRSGLLAHMHEHWIEHPAQRIERIRKNSK